MNASSRFIELDGIRTRYFEKGTGQPLLLMHGGQYGSYYSAYSWSLNFDELSKAFHVFAIDCIGMGFSDNPTTDEAFTMGTTIAHIEKFIQYNGFDRLNLVGHSRGALVVATLALQHIDLVKTLTVIDTNTLGPDSPLVPKDFYDDIERKSLPIETPTSVQAEALANSCTTDHVTKEFVDDLLEISHLPKVRLAKEKMKRLKDTVFIPDLKIRKADALQKIQAGNLKVPSLVVWGMNDPSAPMQLGIDLFKMMSAGAEHNQFHVFDRCGHYSFREHPNSFNSLLVQFILSNQ